MKTYKAFVKDKINGKMVTIEGEYNNKKEFVADLRKNGYAVNQDKVKEKEVFDYIIKYTNMHPWDWKINKVPTV